MTVYADRLANLRAKMAEANADLVALGPTSHLRWLTGADPHGDERPVMLLVSQSHAGFLMPALNANSVREMTDLPFETWADEAGPSQALDQLLETCGIEPGAQVVVDETMRADFALLLLDKIEGAKHRFTEDTVGDLRAQKDKSELEALRASAHLNDAAAQAGFAALREGVSEVEIAQVILSYYEEHGATREFTIVAFDAHGAFPHHHSGATKLTNNMPVLIDTGCRYQGYPSDMTRCGWFGPDPDPEFLKVAEILERAVQAGLASIRPGVIAKDVDSAVRAVISDAGYGEYFIHRTGHGLGIDIHEPPYISATSETVLEAGHVFSVEPGIYLPRRFGVRLEDIVAVTATGADILSSMPRDIWHA